MAQGGQEVQWMAAPQETPPGCPPGLEYLTQVDQILINQQVELLEVMTGWETENKYRIMNTLGQQVYFAAEQSDSCARQCCGPSRPFRMAILDNAQKEVIRIERPLRCLGFPPICCCCCLQQVEVQSPPGTVIGYIKQDLSFLSSWFSVVNVDEEVVLKITGPPFRFGEVEFQILSADGSQEVGKITKQWSGLAKEYFTDADNFGIQFPMDLDVKMKAVMIGATFLIDFMFFENTNSNRRRPR